MINYTTPTLDNLPEMILVFKENYLEAKEKITYLPPFDEIMPLLTKSLSKYIEKGLGLIASDNGNIVGYMCGMHTGPLFGNNEGIVVPLHGHACLNQYLNHALPNLYKNNASLWVSKGYVSHAIVIFADNKEEASFWFENGFGKRCSDAIIKTKQIEHSSSSIKIIKATNEDLYLVAPLHHDHHLYYRQSPIFMPNEEEDALLDLKTWLNHDNHHLWYAVQQGNVLGYMRLQPNGESIVSYASSMMNITGAYVKPEFRNLRIGNLLLSTIKNWLFDKNIELCGVDYESINPSGRIFWEKHFTPYTISLSRRIDERILKETKY